MSDLTVVDIKCPILANPPPLFPLPRPTTDEADSSFLALKSMDCRPLIEDCDWQSRSEIPFVGEKLIMQSSVGREASDCFHHAARMACDSLASPSPVRSWFDPKIRKSLEASVYYAQSPRTALALRKYIPPQFRATAAKAVFQHFRPARVYDPCGGWGDRLIAALATESVELYYVRDVNPLVFAGYAEQCRRFDPSNKVVAAMSPAEADAPALDYFDMVFTSPPYYKIEKYHGKDQSCAKYKGFQNWLNGFLLPMAQNAVDSVCRGGKIIFNVSDVYADHTTNKLCEPLIEFMSNDLGCKLVDIWGYRLSRRVNSRSNLSGKVAEPMLIFEKPGD